MISIARTFGAPETVPAGKPAESAATTSTSSRSSPSTLRDDVHDVAVALDEEAVGDLHRADLGDAADVVAAEVEQHQMLRALLRVGEQFGREREILARRLAAPARAGDRADDDLAVAHPHQDFRARDDDLEAAEIEEAEIGRGIDAPQRAIERERRQFEAAGEALRKHDLEGVARDDVILRLGDHGEEFGLAGVGDGLVGDERRIDRGRGVIAAGLRARRRPRRAAPAPLSCAARAETPATGRIGVTTTISSRTLSNTTITVGRIRIASGTPIGSGLAGGEALHLAHHVVAEIAEDARRHRRQARGQVDARFCQQRAQRLERLAGAGDEGLRVDRGAPVDLGALAVERQMRSGSRPIIE